MWRSDVISTFTSLTSGASEGHARPRAANEPTSAQVFTGINSTLDDSTGHGVDPVLSLSAQAGGCVSCTHRVARKGLQVGVVDG